MSDAPVFTQLIETDNLTRADVESIVAEKLSGLPSMIRTEIQEAIRSALSGFVTVDTVQRMIESAVAPIRTNTEQQLHSIDVHFREAERALDTRGRAFDKAIDQFQSFTGEMRENFGVLKTATEENRKQSSDLKMHQEESARQTALDRSELTKARDMIDDLHADIHGNPREPSSLSLHQLLANNNAERGRQHLEIMSEIGTVKKQVETQQEYIESRRGLEMAFMTGAAKILQNRATLAIFLLGLGTVMGINIFNLLAAVFAK